MPMPCMNGMRVSTDWNFSRDADPVFRRAGSFRQFGLFQRSETEALSSGRPSVSKPGRFGGDGDAVCRCGGG